MTTKIKTPDGEVMTFTTQPAKFGTWVIVNSSPDNMYVSPKDETRFHKELRERAQQLHEVVLEVTA